jgi:hypothetical protein
MTLSDEFRVTVGHLQQARDLGMPMCVRSLKQWFALHGISFDGFLREGIDVGTLRSLNDALADRVIELIEKGEIQ